MAKKITTPVGELEWVKINGKLDTYQGNVLGYSLRFKPLTKSDEKKLLDQLNQELDEAKKSDEFSGKKWLSEPLMGFSEETGKFKFKCKNEFEKNGQVIPIVVPIFDAKGKRMPDDTNIGNGTKAIVAFCPNAFNMNARTNGLTLRLQAIQIIDLVGYASSGSLESYGFTEKEDCDDEECPI